LDILLGGIKKQSLVILAGATGMGKSLLLLNIFINLAKRGIKCLYFDLENGADLTVQRALMIWYSLTKEYFMDKTNHDDAVRKYQHITDCLQIVDHEQLYELGYATGYPLDWNMRTLINGSNADIIAIDPLQAFESGVSDKDVLRVQTDTTKTFKELAQKLNIPIVICHHVRKSQSGGGTWVEDIEDAQTIKYRIPNIDDLKGSSGITQYATDVWAMVRTVGHGEKEGRGKTFFRILKARRGMQGDTKDLWFDEDTLQFIDRANPQATDLVERLEGIRL
jgi:replicative DNA helicase